MNSGKDYDVINPPQIAISVGMAKIVGLVTALVEANIAGSVKEVLVDPQNFDVDNVLSIALTGEMVVVVL